MKVQSSKLIRIWPFVIAALGLLVSACGVAQASGDITPSVHYTLTTGLADGQLAFIGQGGEIDGIANPVLSASPGQTVQITLINGDGVEHDLILPGLEVDSDPVKGAGSQTSVVFDVHQEGKYVYYSSASGQRETGMEGWLVVGRGSGVPELASATGIEAGSEHSMSSDSAVPSGTGQTSEPVEAASIVRDPTDLPASPGDRPPTTVRLELETVELQGQLADGTAFTYWTFDGQVPGPLLRVRVGDTVELTLTNRPDSTMVHSIDLHAVTGPGGGAVVTQVQPGETKSFTFKALNPGLYVYHCATPMVSHHIASGMYGMILVEPEGGLPQVDREFYVMQGEIYPNGTFGQQGLQTTSLEKLLAEAPEYIVFNGAVGALADEHPLQAKTGETVRIFMGVGGPNLTSSFHVIGEIFDRVYNLASLTAPPLTDVQTTLVPPGGATMVEFALEVPGRYILVDHALSRVERGAAGYLVVEGPDNPDVFHSDEIADDSSH